jgi:D-threo-aldose 1-dehydrogenase
MQMIPLGSSGRETTRLGLGCSSVMGGLSRRESRAVLESAYDAGIRHFDVAPSYGFGEAERCLGDFLSAHPGDLTVTTKFGISSSGGQSAMSLARKMLRPVIKALPALKKRISAAAGTVGGGTVRIPFTAENAVRSLERSLCALRVERIDVWLLHEAEASDLDDDGLLRVLEELVVAGKIGTFGVGSEAHKIEQLLLERAAYCRTLQYEWSVQDALIPLDSSFRMHHRSLTENFRVLHEALTADGVLCRRWSEHCGANLQNGEVLARLMLKAALVCNPESVILFSSKRIEHVRENAMTADDCSLEEPALRLYSLVRSDVMPILSRMQG